MWKSESLADNVIVYVDEGEVIGIEILLPKLDAKLTEFISRL